MTGNTENNVNEENHSEDSYGEESGDFGTMLSNARKAQNYSISDINDNIKIPEEVLSALEACDLASLPASTYTQGYIRSYARFLEISESHVLDLYHQMVPIDNSAPDVKLSTEIPDRNTGQSPLKSKLPIYLMVAAIAIIYTGYHYSQDSVDNSTDKAVENELASEEGGDSVHSQELSDSQPVQIEQNARLTDDGELILAESQESTGAAQIEPEQIEPEQIESEQIESARVETEAIDIEPVATDSTAHQTKIDDAVPQPIVPDTSDKHVVVPIPPKSAQISEVQASEEVSEQSSQKAPDEESSEDLIAEEDEDFPDDQATERQASGGQVLSNQSPENQLGVAPAVDSITFYAEDGSWIEVLDANDRRLFYNMLPEGGSKTLTGQAPFSITMGNAKTTHVQINNIDVDFSSRIRSSNTASFKVSNKGQRVIFQR